MRSAEPITVASLVLAIAMLALAVLLAWRQRAERQRRDPGLSEADADHFARQDLRRSLGLIILVLLAPALVVGARLKPRVAGATNTPFVVIWLLIFLLVLLLLFLALLDWISTRLYARRHRRALAKERLEILQEELRRRGAPSREGNGRSGPHGPLGDFLH